MTIREQIYLREAETLSVFATHTRDCKGRSTPIVESELRTEFMRDRDRIVHSKAFRRLKDKTQVFMSPLGSHYRTRLTHTMEVSQLARTIAKALALNEDLTEAIALGHDLGHTPFGHAGERALARRIAFKHNEQSLRIVEKLEKGRGLNLTFEVRDGILNHKRNMTPATLEGMAVNIADRIAYLNHDIADAMRADVLTPGDIPADIMEVLGDDYSKRIDTMVKDVINTSLNQPFLKMSEEVLAATESLRDFMFNNVYTGSMAKGEEKKGDRVIDMLFEHYEHHTDQIPSTYLVFEEEDGITRCIADYISGMTDKYAVDKFEELFVPRFWMKL